MASKTLFVTVGTTKFDKLVHKITSISILKVLKSEGFDKIIIQYGKSDIKIQQGPNSEIAIETFSLKDSLEEDIENADLVISHAGAGSCMEILRAKKPLIVVVNEDLMDNHQAELAEALSVRDHALSCTVDSLHETLVNFGKKSLEPYPLPTPFAFVEFLNGVMGIRES